MERQIDHIKMRRALLNWYDRGNRDMPWRRNPLPWWVWVSEIMLQQTRVESVIGYFNRFIERYPTPKSLAESSLDELMGYWAGLGYYARARNLHKAATQVVEEHGGRVPDDPDIFRGLSGVGRYTCAAVQSIAYGAPMAVLDGNVIRVLSRLNRIEEDPKRSAVQEQFWTLANEFLDQERAGDFNQAMMELGATVCTPKKPKCLLCPVMDLCRARQEIDPETLPVRVPKKKRPVIQMVAGLTRTNNGSIWLVRRPEKGLLGGLWSLPMVEGKSHDVLETLDLIPQDECQTVRHGFTHQIWDISIYPCQGRPARASFEDVRAFDVSEIKNLGLGGPSLKALRICGIDLPKRRGAG
ncbi:MAG: A/G-specific adenine glycosylase [Myxococcota bacterium]|nr:A/G-specific adenine glycosylase [Myxococcota bacterium]